MSEDPTATTTLTVQAPDGSSEDLALPAGLVELLREEGQDDAEVVADVAQVAFTSRAHMLVHHAEEEASDTERAIEERALDLFEERFGQTFGEMTGHDH